MNVTLSEYLVMKGINKAGIMQLLLAFRCRLMYPAFDATVLMRKQQLAKFSFLKDLYGRRLLRKYNVEISSGAIIGDNFRMEHMAGIVIGDGVVIGNNVHIYQSVTIGQKNGKYPCIKDNCTLYPGAKIIGEIVIGPNAEVGTNAVVLNNVPDGGVVAGVPATLIRIKHSTILK